MSLNEDYDAEADVLYLSLGEPRPAVGEVDDKGLLLRFSLDGNSPCGVTIPWFREWSGEHAELASRIAAFLSTPKEEVLSLLTLAAAEPQEEEDNNG